MDTKFGYQGHQNVSKCRPHTRGNHLKTSFSFMGQNVNKRPPGLIAPLLRFWHLLGNSPKNTTKGRDLLFNEGIRLLNMADTSLDTFTLDMKWYRFHNLDSTFEVIQRLYLIWRVIICDCSIHIKSCLKSTLGKVGVGSSIAQNHSSTVIPVHYLPHFTWKVDQNEIV